MKFTTHFSVHSLGTGLWACIPYTGDCTWQTGRSLALVTFSKEFASSPTLVLHHMITSQGSKAWISMLSLSHFIRQGNLLQFLFPPLTKMPKFSRFSGLTSCLRIRKHTGAAWSHVTSLLKKMFNFAHVQHHQDTCVNATNATLKHENTKNVTPEWRTPQKNKRHWSKHAFRNSPKEEYAFNFLLVHWIPKFTVLITLRCTHHRCSSRDIHWKFLKAINENGTY